MAISRCEISERRRSWTHEVGGAWTATYLHTLYWSTTSLKTYQNITDQMETIEKHEYILTQFHKNNIYELSTHIKKTNKKNLTNSILINSINFIKSYNLLLLNNKNSQKHTKILSFVKQFFFQNFLSL